MVPVPGVGARLCGPDPRHGSAGLGARVARRLGEGLVEEVGRGRGWSTISLPNEAAAEPDGETRAWGR